MSSCSIKLIVASNLIYCSLLNPALGTEQSVSSRVLWSCLLRKNSLLHGPDLSWWNLVRWNANSRNKTLALNHLFHANILVPPAISSSLIPCTPCSISNTRGKGHLHDSHVPHVTLVLLQSFIYQCCPQKTMGLQGENNLQCIPMHLKLHQNVRAPELRSGSLTHPYCYHFSTFAEFTWQPQ